MTDTAWFRGEGGGVWEMSLPLPEHQQQKVHKGQLVRVNPDGTDWTAPAAEPPDPAVVPQPVTARPAVNASKADWVGWAVHNGAPAEEAEAMTKADLIEKYGRDPAPPTDPTGGE